MVELRAGRWRELRHQDFYRVVLFCEVGKFGCVWCVRTGCFVGLGEGSWPRSWGTRCGRGERIFARAGDIQQPMVTVDFSYGVSRAVGEDLVEILDFCSPVAVRSSLALREHERLAGVEASVYRWQVGMRTGNLKHARQAEKVQRRAACFEDETMGRNKEGRLAAKEIGKSVQGTTGHLPHNEGTKDTADTEVTGQQTSCA